MKKCLFLAGRSKTIVKAIVVTKDEEQDGDDEIVIPVNDGRTSATDYLRNNAMNQPSKRGFLLDDMDEFQQMLDEYRQQGHNFDIDF